MGGRGTEGMTATKTPLHSPPQATPTADLHLLLQGVLQAAVVAMTTCCPGAHDSSAASAIPSVQDLWGRIGLRDHPHKPRIRLGCQPATTHTTQNPTAPQPKAERRASARSSQRPFASTGVRREVHSGWRTQARPAPPCSEPPALCLPCVLWRLTQGEAGRTPKRSKQHCPRPRQTPTNPLPRTLSRATCTRHPRSAHTLQVTPQERPVSTTWRVQQPATDNETHPGR